MRTAPFTSCSRFPVPLEHSATITFIRRELICDFGRKFDACDGYDPGSSSIPQFALIVTNWLFESPKIPDIPSQVSLCFEHVWHGRTVTHASFTALLYTTV